MSTVGGQRQTTVPPPPSPLPTKKVTAATTTTNGDGKARNYKSKFPGKEESKMYALHSNSFLSEAPPIACT